MKAINHYMICAYIYATSAWTKLKNEERGDTNFVSILIILAIVVVFAGVFIAFGDKIVEAANKRLNDFLTALNGQKTGNIGGAGG